jgi:hypothetical protein
MKCEPQGTIKLDDVSGFQLISATIITKPVFPAEVAFSCLQIPIISKVLVYSMLIQNYQTYDGD